MREGAGVGALCVATGWHRPHTRTIRYRARPIAPGAQALHAAVCVQACARAAVAAAAHTKRVAGASSSTSPQPPTPPRLPFVPPSLASSVREERGGTIHSRCECATGVVGSVGAAHSIVLLACADHEMSECSDNAQWRAQTL